MGQSVPGNTIGGAFVDRVILTALGVVVLVALCRLFRLRELELYLQELWRMVKGRLGRIAATSAQP